MAFDVTTMGAALSSAKTILDLLRNANDAQLAMKISSEIAEIQSRLIDVQQQALTLQTENQQLRDEIRQLKIAADDDRSLFFTDNAYWKHVEVITQEETEEGNQVVELRWDGPFCSQCKDADQKVVRMHRLEPTPSDQGKDAFRCSVHKIDIKCHPKWLINYG